MKDFLKNLLASCLGTLMAIGLVSGMSTLIMLVVFLAMAEEAMKVEIQPQPSDNAILHLSFQGGIVESISEDPIEQIDLNSLSLVRQRTLDAVLLGLREGSRDDRIKGLYLDLQGTPGSWSQMNEIRQAAVAFKESGKWIYAYSRNLSPSFYHLATSANTIALDPVGHLPLDGMGLEMLFFGRLLKEWDIEPRAIRARDNTFKSAIEPFTLEGLSKENRLQLNAILSQRWKHFTNTVESSRGLDPGSLDAFAGNLQPAEPIAAKALGLVDELLYEDQVKEMLSNRTGGHKKDCSCNWLMEVDNYTQSQKLLHSIHGKAKGKGIGLIVSEGAIMNSHRGEGGIISPERISSKLKEMEEDERIAAVVVRINSPGGSAQASEWIWRSMRKVTRTKPIVVSLGPMAASGGYYMASAANMIVTDPLTLTGSIGVFGLLPRVDRMLTKHLDITVDRVHTHPELAMSLLAPISEPAMGRIQNQVDEVYRLFLDRVAEGRGLDRAAVHSLARGRVWSGQDAIKEGLADHQGSLLAAMDLARNLAGLKPDASLYTGQPGDLIEALTRTLEERFGGVRSESKNLLPHLTKGLDLITLKDWLTDTDQQPWTFAMLPWMPLHP